ncbi:molybdenum cofactor guanylyltransferase [Flavisphingomonas formosensis]|uniref:molybdenum cofactor guanylyltransferase n=1 Tax=Flavisphingomonas formosensis TaxID=861534 RepID=UPI0012FC508A|nr:molybdenum cofactor guanylyltransferase [Sphingomonas formosensis]
MSILGAIFAGGQARRFGSDKAAVEIDGIAMLDHVAAQLAPQCDALVVVGRQWQGLAAIADQPRHGLGPLGALAGALVHAATEGYDAVLTSGCDLPDLPDDLIQRLSPASSVLRGQPLVGLWDVRLRPLLIAHLDQSADRSMQGLIEKAGARRVDPPRALANINTPDDLAAYRREELRRLEDPRSSR